MPKIIDNALALIGLQRKTNGKAIIPSYRRSYAAGQSDRLTADWNLNTLTADKAISDHLSTVIARSRQLEKDNRYYKRWLSSLENNVLGADGINMQSKARFERSGKFDVGANRKIESGWAKWGGAEFCSLNGEDDWVETQRIALRSAARDGGVLCQIKRGRDLNPFAFTLNLIEIDLLDTRRTEVLPNGNEIRLGVERNRFGRVVAYHLLQYHPGDFLGYPAPMNRRDSIRVPAHGTNPGGDEILHYYLKDRIMQSVGMCWGSASMRELHHADEYSLAELLQSRAAAAKGGWFENERGEHWKGDEQQVTSADGNEQQRDQLMDFETASYQELPPGVKFVPWDPQHPNQAFKDFMVTMLQGIASGLDIDYATMTGDLSQNSYASTKAGRLEVQEQWKKVQGHFIRKFCQPIFSAWLEMAILTGEVPLPMRKYEDLNKPKFRGRRWPWVDPQKDMDAAARALEIKVRTMTDLIAENGGDFEDTIEQLKLEKEMMEEAGLMPGPSENAPEIPEPTEPPPEEPPEELEPGEEPPEE